MFGRLTKGALKAAVEKLNDVNNKKKETAERLLNVATGGLSGLLLDNDGDDEKQQEVMLEYIEDLADELKEVRKKRKDLKATVREQDRELRKQGKFIAELRNRMDDFENKKPAVQPAQRRGRFIPDF